MEKSVTKKNITIAKENRPLVAEDKSNKFCNSLVLSNDRSEQTLQLVSQQRWGFQHEGGDHYLVLAAWLRTEAHSVASAYQLQQGEV